MPAICHLINIEGLGRELYPELDLWQTAKPFLEKWFHERIGPKAKITRLLKQFPEFAEQFPEIPSLLYKALDNAAYSQQRAEAQRRELELLRQQMDVNNSTTVWAIVCGAVMISLVMLFQ